LRRFSVPRTCTFQELCKQLKTLYQLENLSIKYSDDEGDLISVTTTEELNEAFRLSNDLRPPILRVRVYDRTATTTDTKVPEEKIFVQKPKQIEEEESHQYPPLPISEWDAPKKQKEIEKPVIVEQKEKEKVNEEKDDDGHQYPPLPISEWYAPKKKPVLLVNVKVPAPSVVDETLPITISAQIQRQCVATSADVAKLSQETLKGALPFASGYPQLSNDIATQCRDLANSTAEMSKRLASIQSEETQRSGSISKEASDLSLATLRECQKLSEATAALCQSLSASTIEDCKSFSANSNALLVDTTSHLANFSEDISGQCNQLSSETSARSVQTCSEIRKLIMNL